MITDSQKLFTGFKNCFVNTKNETLNVSIQVFLISKHIYDYSQLEIAFQVLELSCKDIN